MNLKYSDPKIFTGGVDISKWSRLSNKEQRLALSKDWYIYYSFQDPATKKLKRQINIKGGANKLKSKSKRYKFLKVLQHNLQLLLDSGFNPYEYDESLEKKFRAQNFNSLEVNANASPLTDSFIEQKIAVVEDFTSIKEAFDFGLKIKKNILAQGSYAKFKSRVNRFAFWLDDNGINGTENITKISKMIVVNYLNDVLDKSSARNRNNTRTDLGTLFQVFEDNDVINENFVKKINVEKSTPRRNKSYTTSKESEIFKYLEENDPILFLFIKFIAYAFLRPIEICRLKVKDVQFKDREIFVNAKNKPVKTKILPDILMIDLPKLDMLNQENLLFTPHGLGHVWENVKEEHRRDYFTKRYKLVKDKFNLGKEYGLYSFRHTYITKLYKSLVTELPPHVAKGKLMLITGHTSMKALEAYLRDIDAEKPEDYSKHLSQ